MRVFAIPILRNKWAYYCQTTIPVNSRLTQAVDWSSKKWEQLGEAEPTTWKRKLYDRGNNLMNQLDYQEWFLKNVPTKEAIEYNPEKVRVYHASCLDSLDIEKDLQLLLKEREPYHKKYLYYSAYWVPIASTFAIVPIIPNIPLAYNLFRLYSHYKAYKGAQHLKSISLDYAASPELDKLLEGQSYVTADEVTLPLEVEKRFAESSKPNIQEVLNQDIPGVIDLEKIMAISRHNESPGMEVELRRARYQILAQIAKQRFSQQQQK
ncbi:mitochondrial K+-H+ exchange-related-domain-containing protein [Zychaea mexicana]|uniref:mitochondrial K+-H+ exchange-related-domain-containing protein n=1 Tax=Zychaea mexicana TaxID=64656 RepID=UPI0022FE9B72|nr:mitochondrial K+-H+ exchange-related-domain-containing protein [Zychaea mexicana]KAI9497445.1 mitochondrial K+-H+ exchange-related-domain-containing protein [Zychaea mexicana]